MRSRMDRMWRIFSHPVIFFIVVAIVGIIVHELARDTDERRP